MVLANSFYCLGHFKNVYDDDDDDSNTKTGQSAQQTHVSDKLLTFLQIKIIPVQVFRTIHFILSHSFPFPFPSLSLIPVL